MSRNKDKMLTNLLKFTFLSIICVIFTSNVIIAESTEKPAAKPDNVPFTVLVLLNNNEYFCSGVIVDVAWVLTAAHCFYNMMGSLSEDETSVYVLAGSKGLNTAKEEIKSGQAQIRLSKKIEINNQYTWNQKFVNDIALIQVSKGFVISERVEVAVLNSTQVPTSEVSLQEVFDPIHKDEINWMCQSYGYGKTVQKDGVEGDNSVKRQDYVTNKHCHCLEWIRSSKSPVDILTRRNIFLCDSDNKLPQGAFCAGDQGGPLLCSGALRGVASNIFPFTERTATNCKLSGDEEQKECGTFTYLKVFTDLCYFGKWLSSLVKTYPKLNEMCEVVEDWN